MKQKHVRNVPIKSSLDMGGIGFRVPIILDPDCPMDIPPMTEKECWEELVVHLRRGIEFCRQLRQSEMWKERPDQFKRTILTLKDKLSQTLALVE